MASRVQGQGGGKRRQRKTKDVGGGGTVVRGRRSTNRWQEHPKFRTLRPVRKANKAKDNAVARGCEQKTKRDKGKEKERPWERRGRRGSPAFIDRWKIGGGGGGGGATAAAAVRERPQSPECDPSKENEKRNNKKGQEAGRSFPDGRGLACRDPGRCHITPLSLSHGGVVCLQVSARVSVSAPFAHLCRVYLITGLGHRQTDGAR